MLPAVNNSGCPGPFCPVSWIPAWSLLQAWVAQATVKDSLALSFQDRCLRARQTIRTGPTIRAPGALARTATFLWEEARQADSNSPSASSSARSCSLLLRMSWQKKGPPFIARFPPHPYPENQELSVSSWIGICPYQVLWESKKGLG